MWTSVSPCLEPLDGLATPADHQGHIQSFPLKLKPVSEGNLHVSQRAVFGHSVSEQCETECGAGAYTRSR
jgi:hypothetical protein